MPNTQQCIQLPLWVNRLFSSKLHTQIIVAACPSRLLTAQYQPETVTMVFSVFPLLNMSLRMPLWWKYTQIYKRSWNTADHMHSVATLLGLHASYWVETPVFPETWTLWGVESVSCWAFSLWTLCDDILALVGLNKSAHYCSHKYLTALRTATDYIFFVYLWSFYKEPEMGDLKSFRFWHLKKSHHRVDIRTVSKRTQQALSSQKNNTLLHFLISPIIAHFSFLSVTNTLNECNLL